MEAIPRLPMLNFELKNSPEATSFGKLKQFIGECYHEDPDTYSQEIYTLETLRSSAMRPVLDYTGCAILKRYYAQLHALQNRFPAITEREVLSFSWSDVHSNMISRSATIQYEMAAILYNIGCLHSVLGALDPRTTGDGMKLACTHFQRSAWAFQHLRESYPGHLHGDMSQDMLIFMEQLGLAQAQECILEKSLADNRKCGIVAKVTSQIISYYNSALTALMTGGNEGRFAEFVENKTFKKWKRYVKFKVSYLSAILFLYQGQQSEEQQKMGERVTLFQAAVDKVEEAKKESKGMMSIEQVNEALTFLSDVVEAKRKTAKNENEFIYHEEVPDISTISAVQGANLVNGIAFSVTDPEIMGEDIFHRIVPMKAHEGSSLYSEEKASFLRAIATKMEEKDIELKTFMSSLNIEPLMIDPNPRIPQELVDRCAEINAKPNAIPDLITSMSNLADICVDVESMLAEISELLKEEEICEKNYQKSTGSRASVHFGELNREFQKYQEAHQKAGESNETLRKAMGLHVTNLKILSNPLKDLQSSIPAIAIAETVDDDNFKQLRTLLNKVQEMQTQRVQLYENLRDAAIKDDITQQVIAWGDKKLDKLFRKELAKHEKNVAVIEQNLTAQPNILRALTDCYAHCAPKIRNIVDTKQKREQFIMSLIASFDVYEDLLGKSAKGLEFYKKLQGNIQKLFSRVRAAREVQDEERQQRLQKATVKAPPAPAAVIPQQPMQYPSAVDNQKPKTPKLKDYMKGGKLDPASYLPPIRSSPLGSDTATTAPTCVTSAVAPDMGMNAQHMMIPPYNQPPPTYAAAMQYPAINYPSNQYQAIPEPPAAVQPSLYQNPGYTNPIYQTAAQYYSGQGQQAYTAPTDIPVVPPQPSQPQQWDQNAINSQMSQMAIQPNATYAPQVADSLPAEQQPQQNYYSSTYGNYQITANKQYVTGYDQTVSQYVAPSATNSIQSYASHPGYSYNQTTGEYQYGSGYQSDQNTQPNNYYPQYTTTDISQNSGVQTTLTQSGQMDPKLPANSYPGQDNYYTSPYGYQTVSGGPTMDGYGGYGYSNDVQQYPQQQPQSGQAYVAGTYMQSNNNGGTATTGSGIYVNPAAMSETVAPAPVQEAPVIPPPQPQVQPVLQPQPHPQPEPPKSKNSNIDLLSGIDFTAAPLPAEGLLQPQIINETLDTTTKSEVLQPMPAKPPPQTVETDDTEKEKVDRVRKFIQTEHRVSVTSTPPVIPGFERKSSADNLSICSDFSSLDQNFDWDSASVRNDDAANLITKINQMNNNNSSNHSIVGGGGGGGGGVNAAIDDTTVFKMFHKEVERLEKFMESLNVKTLNGITPLDGKWKEIQDLLVKDESRRTTNVAKLFPEKNRSVDHIPYDHSRVLLPTTTDDYINAIYLRELGPSCPQFILTQTPWENTMEDFWSMIWSHKSRVIVCLHTANELLDPYWPVEINKELTAGDYTVTLLQQFELSHSTERIIKLMQHGSDAILNLSILQIKNWMKNSATNILGISHNIITAHRQKVQEMQSSTIVTINCLTGTQRSEIVSCAIAAILATQAKRPVLINVVDVWFRICSQRKGALRDSLLLQLSLQIVLTNAHELLNKRGIMTSYQMKTAQTAKAIEKEEIKDPFSDLDPMWKLKEKK